MAKKATPTPESKEAVMYIGPTKMGALHVTQNSVFTSGVLPAHLAKAVDGNDDFQFMFVGVSGAGDARSALRDPNSKFAQAYRAVAAMEG